MYHYPEYYYRPLAYSLLQNFVLENCDDNDDDDDEVGRMMKMMVMATTLEK